MSTIYRISSQQHSPNILKQVSTDQKENVGFEIWSLNFYRQPAFPTPKCQITEDAKNNRRKTEVRTGDRKRPCTRRTRRLPKISRRMRQGKLQAALQTRPCCWREKPRPRGTPSSWRPTVPPPYQVLFGFRNPGTNSSERTFHLPLKALWHSLWRGPQAGWNEMFRLRACTLEVSRWAHLP